jgi:predicted Zn-dependent protease
MKRFVFMMLLGICLHSLIMYSVSVADNFSYDDLDPDTRNLYIEANAAKNSKQYQEALEKYRKLILILPKALQFKQDLTDIYVDQKKWKEAEFYAKDLLSLEPENKDYQLQYARILMWSKKSKMSLHSMMRN